MPKLNVYDEEQRERIRARLNEYRARHDIGVPTLYQRMIGHLEKRDWRYLDQRSLQRFLNGTHRTSDEKVHRYAKFLDRAAPPSFADSIGAALDVFTAEAHAGMPAQDTSGALVPRGAQTGRDLYNVARDLREYAGRYALSFAADEEPERFHRSKDVIWELTGTGNPHVLRIITYKLAAERDDDPRLLRYEEQQQAGFLMRIGVSEFAVVNIGLRGGATAMLRDIANSIEGRCRLRSWPDNLITPETMPAIFEGQLFVAGGTAARRQPAPWMRLLLIAKDSG